MLALDRLEYRVARASYSNDSSLIGKEYECKDCLLIMIHVEEFDKERRNRVLKKLLNNITWYSRKTGNNNIVLHSFAHLSEDKADPEFAMSIMREAEDKLKKKGLNIHTTPFGYFLELEIKIKGDPIARVFKSL